MKKVLLFVVLFLVLCGCSSASDAGESCDTAGGTEDVCESGTVCGKPSSSATAPVCLKICASDADCTGGTTCNGVEGTSIKGCRTKS